MDPDTATPHPSARSVSELLARGLLGLVLAALVLVAPTSAASSSSLPSAPLATGLEQCDRVHSFGGVEAFVNELAPGQVGCLQGSFVEDVAIRTPGVTVASAPGQTAVICGSLTVEDSADSVTVRGLKIDGSCTGSAYNSVYLRGERTRLENNEITNGHQGLSCVLVGQSPDGWEADEVTIRGNRIHDCGSDPTRDQGVYLRRTAGTRVENNVVYDVSGFTIQFWGDVRASTVAHNVTDGGPDSFRGGVVIGAESLPLPADNVIEDNIISYTKNAGIEGWGGSNNLVRSNCFWQTAGGAFRGSGFTPIDNTVEQDPLFVNRSLRDYHLLPGSPCARAGLLE